VQHVEQSRARDPSRTHIDTAAGCSSGNGGLPSAEPNRRTLDEVATVKDQQSALAALEKEVALWRHDMARKNSEDRLARLTAYVAATQPYLRLYRDAIGAMRCSPFWRARGFVFGLLKYIGRPDASTVDAVDLIDVDAFTADRLENPYEHWLRDNALRFSDSERLRSLVGVLRYLPKISIITPVYEPPESYLRAAIESVIAQIYPNWELCVANDASPSPYVRAVLDEYAAIDPRIKVVNRSENGNISRASNSALAVADGEFVALLDHDDMLTPDALFEVVAALNADPAIDMLYSDEDKIDDEGRRRDPFFKPDWSPESFLARMYTAHLAVFRRSLVSDVGGFRPEFDGSQDYDLVLRVTERTERVHHIPRVLYHWRIHGASVASGTDVKTYAYDNARRAIAEALVRRGEPGIVEHVADHPGNYRVRYTISSSDKVSIVIPTRDHADDLERCVRSIVEKSTYPNYEIVLLDNGSTDSEALAVLAAWERRDPQRIRVVRYDVPFNFSHINNYAARRTSGRFLLFLNNDTEVVTPDWIEALVEQAQRPPIGAVGALLLYADETIQHAGVVLRIGGIAGHGHRFLPADTPGYYYTVKTVNNFSAVTGACVMIRRDVFDAVGGFDEGLAVAFNDVDLCLRIREHGFRIVYVPHAVLYHFESKSRGSDDTPEKIERDMRERAFMQRRWNCSDREDPYYSPHLSLTREDYSIRV
jgi:GT2 family glycosyltransferase